MSTQVRSLEFARTLHGQLLLATAFACLTFLGMKVQVWVGLVPITLQVLFVMLSGLVLGSRLGALSQLEYLAVGLAGAPVFTLGGGPSALLGPTGGYLLGFVPMAYIAGLLAESAARPSRVRLFLAALASVPVLYCFGAMWLATWLAVAHGTSWVEELGAAWQFGVLPFVLVDAGKAIVASAVALSGRTLLGFLRQ